VWLTLPFYDFCGFRSVAVNSVYELQFFTFIDNNINDLVRRWSSKQKSRKVNFSSCDLEL